MNNYVQKYIQISNLYKTLNIYIKTFKYITFTTDSKKYSIYTFLYKRQNTISTLTSSKILHIRLR